jgi:DNA-binding XRE family transcriptional regulator
MLARPDAPEGEIRRVSRDMLDQVGVGDLVLCRLNAPLMPLCLRLIQRGVQARIYGRDVAAALLSTAQEAEFRFPSEQLMPAIAAICADRAARLRRDEPEIEDDDPRMVAIDDTRETLRVLLESCAQQTTRALDAQLKALFADSGAAVWLSSVHRAKGLEADTVWIERPDLLPLQRRSQAAPEDGEWCVAFVAASRAKQRLMLIVDGCERPLHALWGEPDNDDADDDGDSSPVVEVLAPERSPSQLASDRDLREALAEIETLRRELRTQHEESLGERARQIEAERDSLRAAAIETARSIEADPGADPTPSTTLTQRRQLAEIPPWPRATPAQRIRYLRVTAGWSQADLADAAGVSARTVSTAERADGEPWISLTVSNLRAIARALDITLGELLAGH